MMCTNPLNKEVLKDFRSNREDKLQHHLTSQGFFFSNFIKYSLSSVNSIWSEAQFHLPMNIYNFTVRYINNSLPTRKNMARWGLSQSPDCSFALILNHSFMLSLVVNSTLIALPGDTTQSLTSLPNHFNL